MEPAPEGVRVNAIAPGPTDTDVMVAAGLSPEEIESVLDRERDRIPMGRLAGPRDVAEWSLRVAEPVRTHMNGQVVTVDGGLELA
ncbi:SDR family oxidoreductase [Actinacidiphila glaucinigra]|uniref:SDR family oxidoreductase n=1 Tax=Actinacidiphila glaucinigra TaxID=235986 RepID=UPI0029BE9E13|nr:SDR family oxidoreductase [Streptomyces sp. PA03-3a]